MLNFKQLVVFLFAAVASSGLAKADSPSSIWNIKPEHLRTLVASSQVMVTNTGAGWNAYCRCPVVLRPHEIPEVMKKAIVAVEDKRFWTHGGFDWWAIPSIVASGFSRGGSTIPMQLLKNLVFHDLRGSDALSKLERKSSELWYAGSLDKSVGKEELLAAYLNQIEFGGRDIVGLYRASRYYFRKEPKDLNMYEVALLAGMVKGPAIYNPIKEKTRQRAKQRALLVLKLMADQGMITEEERARAEQTGSQPGMMPEFKIQAQAFAEWISETWGREYVREGETIRFFVTIEPRFQRITEQQVAEMLFRGLIPRDYQAGIVMMSEDGRVQAMVGALDWSKRQFNNAVKEKVQPGSTAKLPALIAACESGKSPDSLIVDRPITGNWPANGSLGYRGETTLKEAFAWSRNAAAVRLTRDLGVKKVADISRRLGIDPGETPDAGFVLGAFSTTVMSVTSAYATVANGGRRVVPAGILAVVDGQGNVRANLIENLAGDEVVSRRCVEPTQQVLREVVLSGTGRAARLAGWESFGKTGTTTGNNDAWFVGWSEGRVIGIWMGRRGAVTSAAIAGAGAPSELFKRVATSANTMADYRLRLEVASRETSSRGWAQSQALESEPISSKQSKSSAQSSSVQIPLPPVRTSTQSVSPVQAQKSELTLGRTKAQIKDAASCDVLSRVRKIVVEHLGVEAKLVTEHANFVDDLGADDLDIVELVMAFEEEFNIEIPDDEAVRSVRTVRSTVKLIKRLANCA